jgi:hypothetical protein
MGKFSKILQIGDGSIFSHRSTEAVKKLRKNRTVPHFRKAIQIILYFMKSLILYRIWRLMEGGIYYSFISATNRRIL